jgi:ribosomal protein L12E/L44/L45/RPP1/RPP2
MKKLLSILFAGLFAVASTAALAQDKKAEPKKEEAKPAAKADAKKEEPKKKEKKGGC